MSSLAPPVEQPEASTTPPGETLLRFEDVYIAFEKPVLEGISFQLTRGETKVLLGTSGTGKTLTLKLGLGLLKPDSGRITVLGNEISAMENSSCSTYGGRLAWSSRKAPCSIP